jgi:outer membrane protein assembly factor BamB
MKHWPYLLVSLSVLIILFLSYLANPNFYSFGNDYEKIVDKAYVAPPTRYKELNSSCSATTQYLYHQDRTGVAPDTARPKAQVSIIHHQRPLNIDIHSASKSTPVVDDSGMYVGSDSGWFWKMDHQGQVIWSLYLPGSDNGIHGTAVVDDKKVYIGAYNGFMYALDKTNGDLVWSVPVGHFIGASPLLANGALYIAAETSHPDGFLAKIDCNTGKSQWVSPWFGGHSHSSPSYDSQNKQLLVGANSGRFYAIDEATGRVNWQVQLTGQIKGTPMVWENKVYFSSWDKYYHAYDLNTGKQVWKQYMGGRVQTSLALVPGVNLGLTNNKVGDIAALNLETGEFQWRLRHGDPNSQFSILITKDPKREDKYLAWSRCKEFQLCVLDAQTGQLIHNLQLPGSFTSVPFAYQDKVFISLDKDKGLVVLQ